MYMRAVTYRIVYVGVLSLGIVLGAAFRNSTVQAAPAADGPSKQRVATAATLPIVTLPTIHVRHAAAARNAGVAAVATAPTMAERHSGGVESPQGYAGAASLPTLRLDMPYYSFGKLLPRVGKD